MCELYTRFFLIGFQEKNTLLTGMMDDNIVNTITELYKENKWKEIAEKYHDHPERNKLLWVYPNEENFSFLRQCLNELGSKEVVSIGCGSGLLEWMMNQATGMLSKLNVSLFNLLLRK